MTQITTEVFETLETKQVTDDTFGIIQRYKVGGIWDKRSVMLNKREQVQVYNELGKSIRGEK